MGWAPGVRGCGLAGVTLSEEETPEPLVGVGGVGVMPLPLGEVGAIAGRIVDPVRARTKERAAS